MQSPLVIGTVLQSRYRVLSILGQGGFGRTYLAEDLGRFQERCALKEFVPSQSEGYFSEKAKELFQREATILYQIQHPQIPQFRAIFEQDQRLFIVQDYVEGETYRALLNQRLAQGTTFSEQEVQQFIQQILPVLAHIHSKGIIHRDITPDNIILRQSDRLPVLIDFGVVKEVVTRIQSDTEVQATTVGKMGYAPSEQMQTGNAYPSSDLYSLAVTAIVLLTGKEPQHLYDDHNSAWTWQRYVTVSPNLAEVLNKALSHRPGDRYQSVREMAQALQVVSYPTVAPTMAPPTVLPNQAVGATPTAGPANPPSPPPQPPQSPTEANLSHMNTMAVGRRAADPPPRRPVNRPDPYIPPPQEESVWDSPWMIAAVGTGLVAAAFIGSYAVVRAVRGPSTVTPIPTPTETISPSPTTETPTPTPTGPVEYSQRLNLALGQTQVLEGNLQANETVNYRFEAQQDQRLAARLDGEGVLMTVLGPDGQPVETGSERVLSWQGTLNFTGEHTVSLSPVRGLSQSDYRLELTLLEPRPIPTPTPTEPTPEPTPTPTEPTIEEETVTFPPGANGIRVAGNVNDNRIKRYLVNAQAGQIMSVEVLQGAVALNVKYPDGTPMEDAANVVFWQAQLAESGNYQIDVVGSGPVEYVLDIQVFNRADNEG